MECPVCIEKFNSTTVRPIILPCGHSLCKGCAEQLREPPSCPECRQPIQAQVANLPTNLFLMNLAEADNKPLTDALGDQSSIRFIPGSDLTVGAEIGRGGSGTVYKAKWGIREVALKLVDVRMPDGPMDANNVLFKGFLKELKILHQLSEECQNTCRVHGYTVYNNKPGILLKLYNKGDLQGVLEKDGAMPAGRAVSYGIKIATALQELHHKGVVVADLKPSNILLSDVGEPVLADFSISNVVSSTKGHFTATSMQGTVNYMAPEQIEEGRITLKADIWAWACTMIHCISGSPPWAGLNIGQIALKVVQGVVPSLPTDLPDSLTRVLTACLKKDPSLRPTAADIVDSLQSREAPTPVPAAVTQEAVRLFTLNDSSHQYYSPCGQYLVSVNDVPLSEQKRPRVVRLQVWKVQPTAIKLDADLILRHPCKFCVSSQYLVAWQGTAFKVWNIETGTLHMTLECSLHLDEVGLHTNGTHLVVTGWCGHTDKTVCKVWDLKSGALQLDTGLPVGWNVRKRCTFSHDGATLVGHCWVEENRENWLQVLDIKSGQSLHELWIGTCNLCLDVQSFPTLNGRRLVSITTNYEDHDCQVIKVWNIQTGEVLLGYEDVEVEMVVGNQQVVGSFNGNPLQALDVVTGELREAHYSSNYRWYDCFCQHTSGRCAALWSDTGSSSLQVMDALTGVHLYDVNTSLDLEECTALMSPNGRSISIRCPDGSIQVWGVRD